MTPLEAVAATLLSLLALASLGALAWGAWRLIRSLRSLSAAVAEHIRLTAENNALMAEANRITREESSKVPALVDGLIRVCQENVQGTVKMTEAVDRMGSMMFSSAGGSDVSLADPKQAEDEYEIQELMRSHGFKRKEAEGRVREKSVYENFRVG